MMAIIKLPSSINLNELQTIAPPNVSVTHLHQEQLLYEGLRY